MRPRSAGSPAPAPSPQPPHTLPRAVISPDTRLQLQEELTMTLEGWCTTGVGNKPHCPSI